MNKKNKILILFLYLGLILIFLLYLKFNIPCLFKNLFNIPCPTCGMTRALKLIINFKIIKSFSYNVLAFPFFLIITIILIFDIIDIIFNKKFINKIINIIIKHYYIIIILLIVSWIINIFRHI